MNSSSIDNDPVPLGPYSPRRYLEPMSDNSSDGNIDSEPHSFSSDYSDYQFPDPRTHPGSEHWYRFDGSSTPPSNLCPLPASMSATPSTESEPADEGLPRKQDFPRHIRQLGTAQEPRQTAQKAHSNQHKYSTRIAPNISHTRPVPGPSQEGGPVQGERATIAYMRPNSLRSPQACDACRRRKVRCVVPPPSQADAENANSEADPKVCLRCTRMSQRCVWGDARRGRHKNSTPPTTAPEGAALGDVTTPPDDITPFSSGQSSRTPSIRSPSDVLSMRLPSPGPSQHPFPMSADSSYTGPDPHIHHHYTYPSLGMHNSSVTQNQHEHYPEYHSHQIYPTMMRPAQIEGAYILDDFAFSTPRSYQNTSPVYAPAPAHTPHYYSAPFHEPSSLDFVQHSLDHDLGIPGGPVYPDNPHIALSNGGPAFRGRDDGQQPGNPHGTSMGVFPPFDGDLRGISMR